MEHWSIFSDPRFTLRFFYPRIGTSGEPVERLDAQQPGLLRVHFLTPKSREVYFEVSKYGSLSAVSEYQQHTENLQKLLQKLYLTELAETRCASLPASQYTFEWEHGARTVILVERGDITYRFLFDPIRDINFKILSTLRWLDVD